MTGFFLQLFRTFIFGNVFISLAAAAFAAEWYLLTDNKADILLMTFIFTSTLIQYNLQRLVLIKEDEGEALSERQAWIIRHRLYLTTMLILVIPVAGVLFFKMNYYQCFIAILAGGLSIFYFLPSGGLRKIPFLKPFLIAFTWSMVSVLLPWYEFGSFRPGWIFAEHFFFIFALCILFDIRDSATDRANGVRTIPNSLGIRIAKMIAILSLCISLFALLNHGINWMLSLAYVPCIFVVLFASEKRNEGYYSVLSDGLIILRPLVTWIVYQNSILYPP